MTQATSVRLEKTQYVGVNRFNQPSTYSNWMAYFGDFSIHPGSALNVLATKKVITQSLAYTLSSKISKNEKQIVRLLSENANVIREYFN